MKDHSNAKESWPRWSLSIILFAAVVWFYQLSGLIGVTPGGNPTLVLNFHFNSDTSLWIERIGRINEPIWTEYSTTHPLRPFTWALMYRGVAELLSLTGVEHAAIFAVKLLNSTFLAIGSVLLLRAAAQFCKDKLVLIAGWLSLCASGSLVVAAAPDHFAISFMLIAGCIYFGTLPIQATKKLLYLTFAIIITGGTTITNAAMPIFMIAETWRRNRVDEDCKQTRTLDNPLLLALALSLCIATIFLAELKKFNLIERKVFDYLHLDILYDPVEAIWSISTSLFGAIVLPPVEASSLGYTIEPLKTILPATPALFGAWVAIAYTYSKGLNYTFKALGIAPIMFLLLNIWLHSVWGDETILFSAHWLPILMLIYLVGLSKINRPFALTIIVYVAINQLYHLTSY